MERDQASNGSISHRSFACWLLGVTALLVAAVGLLNWYVDPTGVTDRATRWRIVENATVRSDKLDLYEALVAADDPPEVVLLGSSRTMKFDPLHVERLTGEGGFNAAVSGGVPRDAWLFTQLVEQRQPEDFPHLVWGLDVDAFRVKRLRDGLSTDPRMRQFIPRDERILTSVSKLGALLELQTTKATIRSLRTGGRAGAERRAGTGNGETFSPRGFQEWSRPFPRQLRFLRNAVRIQIREYASLVFGRDAYTRVERGPLDEFRKVVRAANERGDVPTVFLTPYQPYAYTLLDEHDVRAREREVRARLRRLLREEPLRFALVDLTALDSFGGDPAQFYDGVHMTPKNTARVLDRLHRDGLLARAQTRMDTG